MVKTCWMLPFIHPKKVQIDNHVNRILQAVEMNLHLINNYSTSARWIWDGSSQRGTQHRVGYRVFSPTWPSSMQMYWNKRKRLHKKRVQLPQDWFGTPTWPPFHCFGTPILPPWRHVKTLYNHLISNNHEWINCFIKTPTKSRWISPTLSCQNKPEKKRDFRFSHVTRLWKLSTREWTGWMKDQNIMAMNTFKNSSGFKDFTQQDS